MALCEPTLSLVGLVHDQASQQDQLKVYFRCLLHL